VIFHIASPAKSRASVKPASLSNVPSNPYIHISQIEQWYDFHYPSHGKGGRPAFDITEVRTPLPHLETKRDLELARAKRLGMYMYVFI
jgi:hypothetical protein